MMAQAEDTELRDLVIEALEKNGSLAKIRALLRANIFLAFEDETDNNKQNVSLDNILKLQEGILSLSLIHEFLEFCNLKNTLFVYKSETRQGKEYNYCGQKILLDKLNLTKEDCAKEPVLLLLLKSLLKHHKINLENKDNNSITNKVNNDTTYSNNRNCTYIVNEDSSTTTSNSQSDNSLDEKNKLHLRLQLDNSDTDTSSDSARDKTSAEYIVNENVIEPNKYGVESVIKNTNANCNNSIRPSSYYLNDLKINNNSSSDSTSYIDLKPYNSIDEKMLNTTGVPMLDYTTNIESSLENSVPNLPDNIIEHTDINKNESIKKMDSLPSISINSGSSPSLKYDSSKGSQSEQNHEELGKSDVETVDYSNDFSSSANSKREYGKPAQSPNNSVEEDVSGLNKNDSLESQLQNSHESRSSISISDVADLISEKSSSFGYNKDSSHKQSASNNIVIKSNSNNDDDSGDFSESPVPSLSNLSLDVHTD
ncbi:putative uncharacterized protein DDB_G0282133 [Achroia grisella]|uniref:putative uncharacterized protein DDB_G0282133 n=1 Tax=Achroia grisella TaxID=688607 RepID=UPI0027D2DE47|nr:putative uncharacterized protein DDB_G0282133 [Achroia grisella]